jgi:putative phosphoesterase
LPLSVLEAAQHADLIAHLGDFTEVEVARQLESMAPLAAVHGNNDSAEVRERFPALVRLDVEGRRLVLIHGHVGGRTAAQAARAVPDADIVLFGHSHQPRIQWENGRLLFNPGSPTQPRFSRSTSYGILTIDGGVRADIIPLD